MARFIDGRSQFLAVTLAYTLCALLLPEPARAHGLPPETQDIAMGSDRLPAIMSTVGLLRAAGDPADGETQSWVWSCRATLSLLGREQAHLVQTEAGFVAATFSGILRSEEGCEWSNAGGPVDRAFIDIVVHPQNPRVLWAVTSDGGRTNGVLISEDGGLGWRPTGDSIGEVLFERIRVAPSDSQRIYLSGAVPSTDEHPVREVLSYRSDDGGVSWRQQPFETQDGERNLFLLAVDPDDPNRVYARVSRDMDRPNVAERLVLSTDGGESWRTLFEVNGELSSFVQQNDAIFVGAPRPDETAAGADYGLWRSTDGGEHFEQVQEALSVKCLRVISGELWACTSFFDDDAGIMRSADNGLSFDAVLRLEDLAGPMDCGESHTLLCDSENRDLVRDYGLDICLDEPCEEPAADGCSVASKPSLSWMMIFAVLIAIRRRSTPSS